MTEDSAGRRAGGRRPGGRRAGRLRLPVSWAAAPRAAAPRGAVPRAAGLAAVLAVTAALATACGGGSRGANPGASPGPAQQLAMFARCMRNHGVANFYFSASASNGGASSAGQVVSIMGNYVTGVNPQQPPFPAAMQACKHLLPGGGPPPMSRQQVNRMLRSAACMRSHGFPGYPDPDIQDGRPVESGPLPSSIDTSSPQFAAAMQACGE